MTVLAVMLYQTTPWEELTKGLIPKHIDDYLMRMRPPLQPISETSLQNLTAILSMNLMIQPNQICLIVKLYNNRPKLLPDSNSLILYMRNFFGSH